MTQPLPERVRAFVRGAVMPLEDRHPAGTMIAPHLREELQRLAREAGVFAPHVSPRYGGAGLGMLGRAEVFEEAGYSLLGPVALNIAAPDEGNMHMLEEIASPEQKERYLEPLATGRVRSCFAMTEPAPGAGSDPSMLRTAARRADGGWVIDGAKRFISGADGAAFAIVMARTEDEVRDDRGATMLLVDADNPGWRLDRRIETTDDAFVGGHWDVTLDGCFVPDDRVLGEPGLGFRYAQVRLAPARLTHCMRFLGMARRALDIALDRAAEREAFGARLEELGMIQALVADCVIDIESSRALVRQACAAMDAGAPGRAESSVAKVHVSEAVWRVVDRAIQICGGLGVSYDLALARYLTEVRPFRIYDGPSETHRWAIARRAARRRAAEREAGAGS